MNNHTFSSKSCVASLKPDDWSTSESSPSMRLEGIKDGGPVWCQRLPTHSINAPSPNERWKACRERERGRERGAFLANKRIPVLSDTPANIDLFPHHRPPQMDLIEHTNSASSCMFYSSFGADTRLFVATLGSAFIPEGKRWLWWRTYREDINLETAVCEDELKKLPKTYSDLDALDILHWKPCWCQKDL